MTTRRSVRLWAAPLGAVTIWVGISRRPASAVAETKVITVVARAATTPTPPRLLGVLALKVSDHGTLGFFHDLFLSAST